jgi:hypothetical protein
MQRTSNGRSPGNEGKSLKNRRKAMKTILSALLALSVIAGVATSASALDAKTFYSQQDASKY